MNKGLVVGLALCLLALVLGGLFFSASYHEAYWSSPVAFISITVLGMLSPPLGGFLTGKAFACRWRGSGGGLGGYLLRGGAVVGVAGLVLALSAIGLALDLSSTGYWGHPPYRYEGDYVIMRLQIDLFRFAIVPELIGGFLLGVGLQMSKDRQA